MPANAVATSVAQRWDIQPDDRPEAVALLTNLKSALPRLIRLFERCGGASDDYLQLLYRRSHKVYWLQDHTMEIVNELRAMAPTRRPLNKLFAEIVKAGTGKKFGSNSSTRWLKESHAIVEAFIHARHFLTMAVNYGNALKGPLPLLPVSGGWQALLNLYGYGGGT